MPASLNWQLAMASASRHARSSSSNRWSQPRSVSSTRRMYTSLKHGLQVQASRRQSRPGAERVGAVGSWVHGGSEQFHARGGLLGSWVSKTPQSECRDARGGTVGHPSMRRVQRARSVAGARRPACGPPVCEDAPFVQRRELRGHVGVVVHAPGTISVPVACDDGPVAGNRHRQPRYAQQQQQPARAGAQAPLRVHPLRAPSHPPTLRRVRVWVVEGRCAGGLVRRASHAGALLR
jgi:hypothetical protein